jgi:hypothetical protein
MKQTKPVAAGCSMQLLDHAGHAKLEVVLKEMLFPLPNRLSLELSKK